MIDDCSRYLWVIFLKSKYETRMYIENIVKLIKNHHDTNIKAIITNNGIEFMMHDYFSSHGIILQTSCIENPQQNGRVEIMHQHILGVVRALLFQSSLPKQFWSFAMAHVIHITNRMFTPLLSNKSFFECLHKYLLDMGKLKIFRCLCYAATIKSHCAKFDLRSRKTIFLGYKASTKGFVSYNMNTKEIFVSRDVHFKELVFRV